MVTEKRASPDSIEPAERPGAIGALLLTGAGLIAAVAAASCCALPVVLFAIGVSSVWIANVTALGTYQPIFAAGSIVLLAAGFMLTRPRSSWVRTSCAPGASCVVAPASRVAHIGLWAGALVLVLAVAFPYLASHFE
jgi:mercuric ion transport protein